MVLLLLLWFANAPLISIIDALLCIRLVGKMMSEVIHFKKTLRQAVTRDSPVENLDGSARGNAVAINNPSLLVLTPPSLPLAEQLLSSSTEHSDISTSGTLMGASVSGSDVTKGCHILTISLNAASLLIKLPKTCRSSAVHTHTAFGKILAVFSREIFSTVMIGISNCNWETNVSEYR